MVTPSLHLSSPADLPHALATAFSTSLLELQSWEWVYGWTPKFTTVLHVDGRAIDVTVEKGRITNVDELSSSRQLLGQKFSKFM